MDFVRGRCAVDGDPPRLYGLGDLANQLDPEQAVVEGRALHLHVVRQAASAIASCPALRAPAGLRAPVTIDEILDALCALDGGPRHPPGGKPNRLRSTSRTMAA
jgi:hypothetical protein